MLFCILGVGMSRPKAVIAQTGQWSSWSCWDDLNGGVPIPVGWMFGEDCFSFSLQSTYPHWLVWGGTYTNNVYTSVADYIAGYESCDGYNYWEAYSGWDNSGSYA